MPSRKNATATATSYSDAAQAVLDSIRAIHEQIPGYTPPRTPGETKKLTTSAAVPSDFVELVAVAIKGSPALSAASNVNADSLRDAVGFGAAFSPVADELEAMARAVRHTVALRKSAAGTDALNTYNLAKSLTRRPEGADLAAQVAEMRKALGRGGKRRPASPAPVTPAAAATPDFRAGKDLRGSGS